MSGEVMTRMALGSGLDSFVVGPENGGARIDPEPEAGAPVLEAASNGRGGPLQSPWVQWLVLALLAGAIAWGAWATKAVLDLQRREIVSVSLTTILRDFVSSESNRSQTPEMATARTRIFLSGVDEIMKGLKADGKIVLLTEAVAGNTVPDVTSVITEAVRRGFQEAETGANLRAPQVAPQAPTAPAPVDPMATPQ